MVLKHADVHQPWSEWSEDETLHLVLIYNNPFRWKTRRKYFNQAIRHYAAAHNVKLYVVELAYDTRPFEVTGNNPEGVVDIQLRTDCELWHKENLINIGVRHFPAGWKYGGYSDGDFHMTRQDWALEAIHMLQHYSFVQLFSSYADLTGETSTSWTGHRPYRQNSSFAWNYIHQDEFRQLRMDRLRKRERDRCYGIQVPEGKEFPWGLAPGATGGAWAWRRQAFATVGGLLDTCILGSGDWHMAFGLIGQFGLNVGDEKSHCTQPYIDSVQHWIDRAKVLDGHPGKGVLGCVDNFAIHHFHGSKMMRGYGERWQILKRNQYNPFMDVVRDWQGVLRWTGNKPRLRDEVRRYFLTRAEDDTQRGPQEQAMV